MCCWLLRPGTSAFVEYIIILSKTSTFNAKIKLEMGVEWTKILCIQAKQISVKVSVFLNYKMSKILW